MDATYVTSEQFEAGLQRLEEKMNANTEMLAAAVRDGFMEQGAQIAEMQSTIASMDHRLTSVEDTLVSIDHRLTTVENTLVSIDDRLTAVENTLTSVVDRLNRVELEVGNARADINRLEEKINQLQTMETEDVTVAYDDIAALKKRQDALEMQVRELQAKYEANHR